MHGDVLLFLGLGFRDVVVDGTALDRHNANRSTVFLVNHHIRIHAKTSRSIVSNRVAIDDNIEHGEVTDSSGLETDVRRITISGNADRGFLSNPERAGFLNSAFISSGEDVRHKIERL